MINNVILRSIRYTFDFNDDKMVKLFKLGNVTVSREKVRIWLKKDDDKEFEKIRNVDLAIFLNGLIINNRGKKDGPEPEPEKDLNNNMIFRKLKIALTLKDIDVLEIMSLANFKISKHELSAFFRKPDHKHYRECKDQILRNFLKGIQIKYRPGI